MCVRHAHLPIVGLRNSLSWYLEDEWLRFLFAVVTTSFHCQHSFRDSMASFAHVCDDNAKKIFPRQSDAFLSGVFAIPLGPEVFTVLSTTQRGVVQEDDIFWSWSTILAHRVLLGDHGQTRTVFILMNINMNYFFLFFDRHKERPTTIVVLCNRGKLVIIFRSFWWGQSCTVAEIILHDILHPWIDSQSTSCFRVAFPHYNLERIANVKSNDRQSNFAIILV